MWVGVGAVMDLEMPMCVPRVGSEYPSVDVNVCRTNASHVRYHCVSLRVLHRSWLGTKQS